MIANKSEINSPKSFYNPALSFILITLLFISLKWLTFKGFNGSDDLHYSMLASNFLEGEFDAFAVNDIFSGRVLLIAFQAFIYLIIGINTISTIAGTIFITILAGYLTLFKLAKFRDAKEILLGSALFYFNPVIQEAANGVMPDVYIMSAAVIILIVWKKIVSEQTLAKCIPLSILSGFIIFLGMFLKENVFVFIPFIATVALLKRSRNIYWNGLISIATFFVLVLISGFVYKYYTGDFYFRVQQITNSDYPNPCNFASSTSQEKITRMTHGVWTGFVNSGFYPVILGAILLLLRSILQRKFKPAQDFTDLSFAILFLLGLYFPFSVDGYQPLCMRARHFTFLLPPAIIICTKLITEAQNNKKLQWIFVIASALILSASILTSVEKWNWMIYGLLFCYFTLVNFVSHSFARKWGGLIIVVILSVSTLDRLFFNSSNWYQDLTKVSTKLDGNHFYFPDHDNMMHWKLIKKFNRSVHAFNVDKNPYKVYQKYYERLDTSTFHPGWFIVNKDYNISSMLSEKLTRLESVGVKKKMEFGSITAYYVEQQNMQTIQEIFNP